MSSRPTRGGRVTQTRRRVSAPAPAFGSDEEVVSIGKGVAPQPLTTRPRADSDVAEPVGGGSKRQRTEDDGGTKGKEQLEDDGGTKGKEQLDGGNLANTQGETKGEAKGEATYVARCHNVLHATKSLECEELLVTKLPGKCNVDTEDKEQPAAAKATEVAARLKCKSCLYVFPASASAERHSSAVNPSGKAPPALWRCAPQAPDVSTLEEFKNSRVNTKYVYPAVVPLPPPPRG